MDFLRVLLVIVTIKDLEYHQININNTFIELKINKIIYIIPSKGVKILRKTALKVLKSLYNLK
jgi:hypothetical protein